MTVSPAGRQQQRSGPLVSDPFLQVGVVAVQQVPLSLETDGDIALKQSVDDRPLTSVTSQD